MKAMAVAADEKKMAFQAKKLNNVKIKPIEQKGGAAKPVKGADLFAEPYANIAVLAKKKSGKTTVVKTIIERCATKDTRVLVFCASFHKDKNWLSIQEWCEDNDIDIQGFTSIVVEGENKLNAELEMLKFAKEKDKKKSEEPTQNLVEIDEELGFVKMPVEEKVPAPDMKPPRKSRYQPLDFIFVFDDIGDELKDKTVAQLLKTNRHWKSKVIVSTQYITDLAPASRRQFDYWLLFAKLSPANLEMVRLSAGLPLEEKEFLALYNQATKERYSFLYIDTNDVVYRRNFDTELSPPAEKVKQ